MDNPLGISTSLFKDFSPERHLPLMAELGIYHVELSTNCYPLFADRQKMRQLATVLTATGMVVNSVHVPFVSPVTRELCTVSDVDENSRRLSAEMSDLCLDSAVALGGRYLVVHPSGEPIAEGEREERLDLCRRNLSVLAERVEGLSAKVAVECLPRTCLGHDSRELLAILDAVGSDALGVCLDVNHANLREDVLEATRRYGERILTLHISDNDGIDERHWLPTRGIIPWRDWLATLDGVGFRGPLTHEVGAWDAENGDRGMVMAIRRTMRELMGGEDS